jgi:hypothetical protein
MSNSTTNPADGRPTGGGGVGRRVLLLTLSLMLLPVGLAACLFPLLAGGPFESPDGIDPAAVDSLRVFVLNRSELDGGDDIGPFQASADDIPALLAPLRGLTPLPAPPESARGPWLGEYRVRTTDRRRGTVRLYWSRQAHPAAAAAAGPAAAGPTRPVLRAVVGDRWFEGGDPRAVIAAATAAVGRVTAAR